MRTRGLTSAGVAALASLALACSASAATLSGDFDGDGRDDLAIGIQSEAVGGFAGGGAVQVIYGSRGGLSRRDRIITRATRGVNGAPGSDGFGSALAAGDFDGDGFDDLAVGAPFDDVGTLDNVGTVQVLYGGRRGLTGRGDQLLRHGRGGLPEPKDEFEGFGWTLAAGNVAGDRHDDLTVFTFNGQAGGVERAGYVEVLRGGAGGISTRGVKRFSAATRGVAGDPQKDARFGAGLAIGDIGRSERNELAVGVPGQTIGGGATRAGCVHVLYGSRRGVRAKRSQYLDQYVLYGDGIGVDGTPEIDDFFGVALTIANWDDRAKEDLVIGAPGEDVTDESPSPTANSGLVSFAYGGPRGVRTAPQPVGGLMEPIASDTWTAGAGFGTSVASADIARSRREEVFIGSPHSDLEGVLTNTGAVGVVYGEGTGYDSIQQGVNGIEGAGSNGDLFGLALGAGDFNGRGPADLAIGVPNDGVFPPGAGRTARRGSPTPVSAGSVQVVPGGQGGIVRARDRILFQGDSGLAGNPEAFEHFGIALSGPESGPTSD